MRHTCTGENNSVKALASFPSSCSSRLFGHLQYRKAFGKGLIGWQCITKVSSSEHHQSHKSSKLHWALKNKCWFEGINWPNCEPECFITACWVYWNFYRLFISQDAWSSLDLAMWQFFMQCSVLIAHGRWNLHDDSNCHGFEFSWKLWPHL